MAKGQGGKTENFAITTDGQCRLELPNLLCTAGEDVLLCCDDERRAIGPNHADI